MNHIVSNNLYSRRNLSVSNQPALLNKRQESLRFISPTLKTQEDPLKMKMNQDFALIDKLTKEILKGSYSSHRRDNSEQKQFGIQPQVNLSNKLTQNYDLKLPNIYGQQNLSFSHEQQQTQNQSLNGSFIAQQQENRLPQRQVIKEQDSSLPKLQIPSIGVNQQSPVPNQKRQDTMRSMYKNMLRYQTLKREIKDLKIQKQASESLSRDISDVQIAPEDAEFERTLKMLSMKKEPYVVPKRGQFPQRYENDSLTPEGSSPNSNINRGQNKNYESNKDQISPIKSFSSPQRQNGIQNGYLQSPNYGNPFTFQSPFLQKSSNGQISNASEQAKHQKGAKFIGSPEYGNFNQKVASIVNPLAGNKKQSEDVKDGPIRNLRPLQAVMNDLKRNKNLSQDYKARDPRLDEILQNELQSPQEFMKDLEKDLITQLNQEDPLFSTQNEQERQQRRDKVSFYKDKLMRMRSKINIKLTPVQKLKAIIRAVGRLLVLEKDIRARRMVIKSIQLTEYKKLIDLNQRIARGWVINMNRNMLKTFMFSKAQVQNMDKGQIPKLNFLSVRSGAKEAQSRFTQIMIRIKTLLDNMLNNSISGQIPDPLIKYLSQVTKLGVFFPPEFFNRYERLMGFLDSSGSITRLVPNQKMIMIGFFIFDKVILRDIVFRPSDEAAPATKNSGTTSKSEQKGAVFVQRFHHRSLKNLKILGFTLYYLLLTVVFQIHSSLASSKIDLMSMSESQQDEALRNFCRADEKEDGFEDIEFIPRFEGVYSFFIRNHQWYQEMQKLMKIILDRVQQIMSLQDNQMKKKLKMAFDKIVIQLPK